MWRNYVTVGFRALMKSRTYAFINIFGLAIGMAACLMILLYVRYEFSYDRWIPEAERVYQIQSWYKSSETGQEAQLQMTPYQAGKSIRGDFPQVEGEVYVTNNNPVFFRNGQATMTEDYLWVDGNFLDIVPLPLARGDRNALAEVNSAVITQSEARRRFGTDNVVGQTMTLITRGVSRDFRITGVLRDIPRNSHFRINSLIRIDLIAYNADVPGALDCWGCQNGYVYVKLRPGADPQEIQRGFPAWERRRIPDENAGEARFNAGDDQDWHIVNVADIHLGRGQAAAMAPGNDRTTIVTFAVIAFLILGMAVVNFTNLATARASQRAREVALRKALGATRKQLITQFVGESVIVAVVAMLIALALVELLMPSLAAFLEADMRVTYFGADGVVLPVLALVVIVGIFGGLYPAFFLSRFEPATVLKANKSSSETPGTGRMRNILVVAQFAVSIALIICTAVIYGQTVYARTVDPGFNRSHILQIDGLSRYQLLNQGETIAERVRRVPGVESVGRTNIGVATQNNNNTGVMVPGVPEPVTIGIYNVDEDFMPAMGMRLLAGRWFDPQRPMDDMTLPYPPDPAAERALAARGANVVINELAARRLGFNNPRDAVGRSFRAALVDSEIGLVPITVIGVVRDTRFRNVKLPVDPIIFQNSNGNHTHLAVRFNGNPADIRAQVERVWKGITTEVPFEADFSEDIMAELYEAEDARAKTFAGFAVLAIIVACLGLFGLAAFTAERRTKEIGIRKVMGARTRDIVQLLAWQFSKPIIIANLIAWPVAWWVMRDWLNTFDARVDLGPAPFVLAGLIALVIAIGTIAGHAIKVARANPIHALRYE
ncbi:ABC transporter permease [Sphingosinicella sp. LHD-64]|uniref:ABC transporter permease n=1 Tax=Sphingosinicella sp. LHD-64 TaxID=3072139 RepID=UPI00280FE2AC|nr:ABC transporter permease [Sphingosinicella sp. LHD-64]MDQ8756102.1 ABC transporter permease [Sphingosinicella sp. LHD-64]